MLVHNDQLQKRDIFEIQSVIGEGIDKFWDNFILIIYFFKSFMVKVIKN